ncbi:MAG: dihydropteroate synthase, partial [Sphingorhabdus sp.]
MTRIYLRPTGFIDSPQQHDGASARLAGTMLWATQIEVIDKTGAGTTRKLVDLREWEGFTASLPVEKHERCVELFGRMTSLRAPLQLGQRTIRLDQPQVMAILNATPDSFSDSGKFSDLDTATSAAITMSSAGAAIIDVGGESTRPGAELVWEGEEISRVVPLIERLANAGTAVSVDTRKAAVMKAAVEAGAGLINDISALLYDDRALEVAKAAGVPVVLMHAPSQSSDPHKGGAYGDVVTEIFDWLEARVSEVELAGIERQKILIDPGIGFGKSLSENLAIIN